MATPASSGGVGRKSKKRKMAEAYHATNNERLRPDGLPTAARAVSMHTMPRETSYELPHGTQHNPLEIESSPEPEAKMVLPGHAAYLSQMARPEVRPETLTEASVHVQQTQMPTPKPKYYAVPRGHRPGIYTEWADVEKQIRGWSGAKHKRFATVTEARDYVIEHYDHGYAYPYESPSSKRSRAPDAHQPHDLSNFSHFSHNAAPADLQTVPEVRPIVASPEPTLSPEQQHVVDLILEGHNVFYTGSAGCGKSTILKAFVRKLQERGRKVKIVAPTNLAALNVNGQTTWTYAGWTPDSMKKSLDKLMQAAHGTEVWERFDKTDVLVLDEISMVEVSMHSRKSFLKRTDPVFDRTSSSSG